MTLYQFIVICLCGFVSAGVVRALWTLVSGHSPKLSLLLQPGVLAPLRGVCVAACAPVLLAEVGLSALQQRGRGFVALPCLAMAVALCFVHGVVVLVSLGLVG